MHTLPNRGIIYLAARFVIASLSRTSPRGGGVFRCCRVDRNRRPGPQAVWDAIVATQESFPDLPTLRQSQGCPGAGATWHGRAGVPRCRVGVLQQTKGPWEETALYCHLVFLCSVAIAVLSATSASLGADSERCQELSRRFRTAKPQITAIEVSLTLFSAAGGNCIGLATDLPEY